MASKVSMISCTLRAAVNPISTVSVTTTQIRTMAHNPKWMREKKRVEDKLANLRTRLLTGEFRQKKTPSEMRKSRLFAPEDLPPALSGPVSHMVKAPLQTWIFNLNKDRVGIADLKSSIFDADLSRKDLVHKTVVWQLAKRRAGTHQSLNRSTVTGTGKKPHPQKKSGRARASTLRSPLHYKGARAFPLRNRDYSFALPIAIRRKALNIALSAKRHDGRLIVIDAAKCDTHKTSLLKDQIEQFTNKRALIITGDYEEDPNFVLASRNISQNVSVLPARGANVYDIVRSRVVFITLQGLRDIEIRTGRVSRSIKYPGQKYELLPAVEKTVEVEATL